MEELQAMNHHAPALVAVQSLMLFYPVTGEEGKGCSMKSRLPCVFLVFNLAHLHLQAQSLLVEPDPVSVGIAVDPSEQQILQQLFQRRELDLDRVPLTEFAKRIRSFGVPTYLDERHLEDAGVGTDTPVTVRQASIRLVDALELGLREKDLAWTIRGGSLIISSAEYASESLVTKLYDVRHLTEFTPIWGATASRTAQVVYEPDFESLIQLIEETIAPDTWTNAGGTGAVAPYSTRRIRVLVISQTYPVHFEIQALLQRLGQMGGFEPLEAPRNMGVTRQEENGQATRLRSSRLRRTMQGSAPF
jgi:hypothetical protein